MYEFSLMEPPSASLSHNTCFLEEIHGQHNLGEIIGNSPSVRKLLQRVQLVAPTDAVVLITGETGSGKELVARAIHKLSKRSSRALVSVNCAALPQALIASELFGHEKGAFTGALQRHVGRFEIASGGTILLDEVGELPLETQVALLRVLQEREVERVGGNHSIQIDARVIAATNRDLQASIASGSFRGDLFYRLNVFPIEVPPLRQRPEDIPALVTHFVIRYAAVCGKKISTISQNSMDLLRSYPWPGNVRELQNVVERSVIVCTTETFSVDESWLASDQGGRPSAPLSLPQAIENHERVEIEAALAETNGKVYGSSGAAMRLGLRPSTLESRIKALSINKYVFKSAALEPRFNKNGAREGRV